MAKSITAGGDERLRDVREHRRLYPRHAIVWIDGRPFYCTGRHDRGEEHDWRPVPHYEEER